MQTPAQPPDLTLNFSEASWRQEDEGGLCFGLLLPHRLLLLPLLRVAAVESPKLRTGQRWAFILGAPLIEPTACTEAVDVRAALLAGCAANIVRSQG